MKGEVYPFGIVGMANKGDCLQKGESVKFQLCVLGQNAQTMAYNITPLRRATVECVKDQVIKCYLCLWVCIYLLYVDKETSPSFPHLIALSSTGIKLFCLIHVVFIWTLLFWEEDKGKSDSVSKEKIRVIINNCCHSGLSHAYNKMNGNHFKVVTLLMNPTIHP